MLKWFWPGVTWTAALTALALWFGTDRIEADISARSAQVLAPYNWAGFDVDGRDLALKGMAPDPEMQQAAILALRGVSGVGDISDLTTILPAASPYIFKLTKSGEGIVLSGFVPDNSMRDVIMAAAESAVNNGLVYDEMALARGAGPEFEERVLFAVDLAGKLSKAEIEISEAKLSLKGVALSNQDYDALTALLNVQLGHGLELSGSNVARP